MGILAAVLADAGRIALDVAGIVAVRSNGGVNSNARPSSPRISSRSTAAIARRARSGSAAPDMTAQDWAIESIRHSSLAAEPSGVPSSNHARRYQPPSQASRSERLLQRRSLAAPLRRALRFAARFRHRSKGGQATCAESQASQTLSPLPPSPTLFMPSFQSPPPISGSP